MRETIQTVNSAPTEAAETTALVAHGFQLARELGISKVLVYAELVIDQRLVGKHREAEALIWVTTKSPPESQAKHETFIEIPGENTNRVTQVTMGVMIAVFQGSLSVDESVVCLSGTTGSKRLDNLQIINPKRDFTWFANHKIDLVPKFVPLKELLQILNISLQLASEGREGKSIGTIFVIGDVEELSPYLKDLILNPVKGHLQKDRSIHDSNFFETIRELAALDGAFIITPKGIVEHAAVFLGAPQTKQVQVAKGLGSRHLAAAAITARTQSVAIALSESSGKVSVYCQGQEIMALDGNA